MKKLQNTSKNENVCSLLFIRKMILYIDIGYRWEVRAAEGDKDMEQVDYGKDVFILKKFGENKIETNAKITSKLLALEIDFVCKIERVLSQYNELT